MTDEYKFFQIILFNEFMSKFFQIILSLYKWTMNFLELGVYFTWRKRHVVLDIFKLHLHVTVLDQLSLQSGDVAVTKRWWTCGRPKECNVHEIGTTDQLRPYLLLYLEPTNQSSPHHTRLGQLCHFVMRLILKIVLHHHNVFHNY